MKNRPDSFHDEHDPAQFASDADRETIMSAFRLPLAGGMSPYQLAERVFEAIHQIFSKDVIRHNQSGQHTAEIVQKRQGLSFGGW